MTIRVSDTENLSASEQFALITDIQNVPTTVTIQEDGSEYVVFGVTPASEAAGARLVSAFWPAITAAARRTKLKGNAEEAEAVALEAFVRAVREYDLTTDTPFHHTIGTRLTRAVLLADREEASTLTVPATQVARYHRAMHANGLDVAAAYADCQADAAKWDLSGPGFAAVWRALTGGTSLQAEGAYASGSSADGASTRYDVEHSTGTPAVTDPVDDFVTRQYVSWLLTKTTERQERICRLAYGFTDGVTERLRVTHGYREGDVLEDLQVADCLEMARSTVNRDRTKALATMRTAAENAMADE